ncbi:FMN-binding negative transcriptional regulator [Hydromonas duriensis]|uniref:PaiB family negative transcriptional regulator n=1 Tax=Hydromonas duriensis TaxID=1527608 RepID=A0A4R6Y974_9BURK|nr:FMN-binding negative transcriptional regulator [Hydromonas duriensis]TDR31990.1 PaiB family negative transcriptional regulator [Hydromonas duriensis]
MYTPAQFNEANPLILRELMRQHPLAMLVTLTDEGLNANPIPLIWQDDGSTHGVLRGHVARANPLWQDFDAAVEALAIFQGPTAYISPSWYPTKAQTHKVVPTYNYATVQAHGALSVHDDSTWVRQQISDLTTQQESAFDAPWQVTDAPEDYITANVRAIVGIEIRISRLVGKWKVSQNQPANNQRGVYEALQQRDNQTMAACVHAHFKMPEEKA